MVTGLTGVDQFVGEAEVSVKRFVCLCDDITAFLDRREVDNLCGDVAVDNLAVRAFDEVDGVENVGGSIAAISPGGQIDEHAGS